ncbi:MAG: acetyltransferase [Alcaligenaceae bacterium]|nr:MAG: acetyltransferase [Alcaligenaceae bacterium]
MKRLLIIGAGGHGRSVAGAVLLRKDYHLTAFLDDAPQSQQRVWDWPVWDPTAILPDCRDRVDAVVVALGNNKLREAMHLLVRAAGLALATVVHPSAFVSPRASVGEGSTLIAGAIVGTGASLAEGVIVNCGAVVDHDCRVEPFGHLGINAGMSGGAVLGHGAWMHAGTTIGYGVELSAGLVLRPGEVVNV